MWVRTRLFQRLSNAVSNIVAVGAGLLLIVFVTFASMISFMRNEGFADYWEVARVQEGGGYFGGLTATALTTSLGSIGAIFVLVVLGVVGAILVSGINRHAGQGVRLASKAGAV